MYVHIGWLFGVAIVVGLFALFVARLAIGTKPIVVHLLVLLIIYRLVDLKPTGRGCTFEEIWHSSGGLLQLILFNPVSLTMVLQSFVERDVLAYDEEARTFTLRPSGLRLLEYGFPKQQPPRPPPPDDGEPT